MSNPTDNRIGEKIRFILQVLSHGKMRRKEVERQALPTRWNETAVGNKMNELAKNEDFEMVKKEKQGGTLYYYRTDNEFDYRRPKPQAAGKRVNDSFSALESIFGLEDAIPKQGLQTENPTSTDHIQKLIYTVRHRSHLLSDSDQLERFFSIFDKFVEQARSEYLSEEADKYSLILRSDYILFFLLVDLLYDNWQTGQENTDFQLEIGERLPDLVDLLSGVPSEMGLHIHRLITRIDVERGKKPCLENMLLSEMYHTEDLLSMLYNTYHLTDNLDSVSNDLIELQLELEGEPARQAEELLDTFNNRFP